MAYLSDSSNQRRDSRVNAELPVNIGIGSQLTLNGQLKDLSLKSAFIRIKSSVYFQMNDELKVTIHCSQDDPERVIEGMARISRLVPGEGFAVYFTKMEDSSTERLRELLKAAGML